MKWTLFLIFVIFQIADIVSTVVFLKEGKAVEGNPLAKFFIGKLGVIGGLAFIKVPVCLFVAWIIVAFPSHPLVPYMLTVCCVGMLWVIIHNWRYIKK